MKPLLKGGGKEKNWAATYRNNVEEAEDDDDNARGNDNSPEAQAKRLLASGFLVEVSERVNANNEHGAAEGDESVIWAQKRPIASEVALEDTGFRHHEEDYQSLAASATRHMHPELTTA